MAIHKLDLTDFHDADYSLFAIHCDQEDYHLAHSINTNLNARLKRLNTDLDFKSPQRSFFSLFEWENYALESTWNLMKNNCKIELKSLGQGLFAESQSVSLKTVHLLQEHPTVDYFLKISGNHNLEKKTLESLNKISTISMVYALEVAALRSKEYLILN